MMHTQINILDHVHTKTHISKSRFTIIIIQAIYIILRREFLII